MFHGSRDFNKLTFILLFGSVIILSGFRTHIGFWGGVSAVSPTGLSLSHTANNKTFSVSWTAGSGNGGASGCRLEYQRSSDSLWVSLGTVNCDASGASIGTISLPGDGWNGGVSWSSIPVRLYRISDSIAIGNLGNVTCSAVSGGSSSTPSFDENCNNVWDDTSATASVSNCTTYSGYYCGGGTLTGAIGAGPGPGSAYTLCGGSGTSTSGLANSSATQVCCDGTHWGAETSPYNADGRQFTGGSLAGSRCSSSSVSPGCGDAIVCTTVSRSYTYN